MDANRRRAVSGSISTFCALKMQDFEPYWLLLQHLIGIQHNVVVKRALPREGRRDHTYDRPRLVQKAAEGKTSCEWSWKVYVMMRKTFIFSPIEHSSSSSSHTRPVPCDCSPTRFSRAWGSAIAVLFHFRRMVLSPAGHLSLCLSLVIDRGLH